MHASFWQLSHFISCKQITLLPDGVILSVLYWMLSMDMQPVHLIKVCFKLTSKMDYDMNVNLSSFNSIKFYRFVLFIFSSIME